MSSFLETYGKSIFVLVLVAILVAFAHPLGAIIKDATTKQVNNVDKIGTENINGKSNGNIDSRPLEPTEIAYNMWYYIDKNYELVISQEKITAPKDALVKEKQVDCNGPNFSKANQIKTVRFEGAIKPNTCTSWFTGCINLIQIKNIENLYTNKCLDMSAMFMNCESLVNIDLHNFDTSNVLGMSSMFSGCKSLTMIDISNFKINNNIATMENMFYNCEQLTTINISQNIYNKLDILSDNQDTNISWYFGISENKLVIN